MSKINEQLSRVQRYYDKTESRFGYKYLLHGTKHFGWYEPGESKWHFTKAMRAMEDKLGEKLDLPEGSSVLDAGCGMGEVARHIAQSFKLDVTGIDILDFNLEEAKRRSLATKLDEVTRFEHGDYHDLNFADEQFDGAYTMETFVHAADAAKALSEFYRVLRPGGKLVMFEYSREPKENITVEADQALTKICDLGAMPTWFKMFHGDMESMIQKSGFDLESSEDATERMLPMLHAFSLLGRFPYFVTRATGQIPKMVNAMSGVEMYKHRDAWRYNIIVARKPHSKL